MEDRISEDQFLSLYLSHPLRDSMSQISDVIHQAPFLCIFKDASTRKYLMTNQFHTVETGLQPEEMIGLKVEDLNCGYYEGGHDANVKKINELDSSVIANKNPVFHKELLVTYQGFLRVGSEIRTPVIGRNNTTIAILAYDMDLTLKEDPLELFTLYKKLYSTRQQAIEKFLCYLEINTYFCSLPTNSEMNILIAMVTQPSHKQVAKLLNMSSKTVDHHVWLLSRKLKESTTQLDDVIKKMRSKWILTHAN